VIIAAGLTPAWQTIMRFRALQPGEVNRAYETHHFSSGKVLNVAVALAHLGAECQAVALVGGPAREAIDREFSALGISRHWVVSRAAIRSCVTVLEDALSRTTELVENAAAPTADELDEFAAVFAHSAEHAKAIVLTGSLPAGVPTDFYQNLLAAVRCPVVLDARGPELLAALEHRPLLVKPNREELAATVGRAITSDRELREAMSELARRGAQWILMTDGAKPAWLFGSGVLYKVTLPRVENVVNPIGSGDCVAAGVAWAISQGKPPLEAVAWGLAAGAENVTHLLAGRFEAEQVACRVGEVGFEEQAT
jgi:tagatose 6-phosphate kinase